jgi:hypothetical protein
MSSEGTYDLWLVLIFVESASLCGGLASEGRGRESID